MDSICNCHSFEFIPIGRQPAGFVEQLEPKQRAQLLAACQSVAEGFADGRPHGSRSTLISSATLPGLFEIRVVWPGVPEPQLRLICIRSGTQILVARGFVQEGDRRPSEEVKLAEDTILTMRGAAVDPGEEEG